MTEMRVTGNKEVYHSSKEVDLLTIELRGDLNINSERRSELQHEQFTKTFDNGLQLLEFSKEIQGANKSDILLTLNRYNVGQDYFDYLNNSNKIEISLLKSVFLIYHWIHLAIDEMGNEIKMDTMIYDNFTLDLSKKRKKQKDIYFIPKEFNSEESSPKINRLIELNLLAKLELINAHGRNYISHFIPLIKPGVNRSLFGHSENYSASELVDFWKSILKSRNISMQNWQNNRF